MFRTVIRWRVPILLASFAVTALFATQIPKLRLEPDSEAYVPENHPIRVFWNEAKERFGLGREILVAVEATGRHGVFTPPILAGLTALTDDLTNIDGVVASQVRSLSTAEAIIGTTDGLEVEPFFDEPPATLRAARKVRRQVFRNPVFLDRLVSRDGTIAAIVLKTELPGKEGTEVYARVEKVVERHTIPGARILIAGMSAIDYVYGRQMTADLQRLIPFGLAAVVVILYLCFPTVPLRSVAVRSAVAFAALAAWNAVQAHRLADPIDAALERHPRLADRLRSVLPGGGRGDVAGVDVGPAGDARHAHLHRGHARAAAPARDRRGRRDPHHRRLLRAGRSCRAPTSTRPSSRR